VIDLSGRIDASEIDDAAEISVEKAEQLRGGFDIITDLSGFRPPSPEAAKPIKRAQKHLKEMGVDRVVRVVYDETSQVVVNAFERRSKDVGSRGEQASSLQEAQRILDKEAVGGYAD
jgi:hypothetical protein